MWGTEFALPSKYTRVKALGQGSYGVISAATEADTGVKVAVKKIGTCCRHCPCISSVCTRVDTYMYT